MTNVSFRYVFGIYILALILFPFANSCESKKGMSLITEDYRNIIHRLIDNIDYSISRLNKTVNKTCQENQYQCDEKNLTGSILQMICSERFYMKGSVNEMKCNFKELVETIEESFGCYCPRVQGHTGTEIDCENPRPGHMKRNRICKIKKLMNNLKTCYILLNEKYSSGDGT